jgi:hypothetical protein
LGNSPAFEVKLQTPGNYPKESIEHLEHGESLKSRMLHLHGEEIAKKMAYKLQTPGNYPNESIPI